MDKWSVMKLVRMREPSDLWELVGQRETTFVNVSMNDVVTAIYLQHSFINFSNCMVSVVVV